MSIEERIKKVLGALMEAEIKAVQDAICAALEPDIGFPLTVEIATVGSALVVKSADLSMGEALGMQHKRLRGHITPTPEDDLLSSMGAFMAMVLAGHSADFFTKKMPYKRRAANRSLLMLAHVHNLVPGEAEPNAGGVRLSPPGNVERIFFRNLINFAGRSMIQCVSNPMGIGVPEELRAELGRRYRWSKNKGPIFLDLKDERDRAAAIRHLGCEIMPDWESQPARNAETDHHAVRRIRPREPVC